MGGGGGGGLCWRTDTGLTYDLLINTQFHGCSFAFNFQYCFARIPALFISGYVGLYINKKNHVDLHPVVNNLSFYSSQMKFPNEVVVMVVYIQNIYRPYPLVNHYTKDSFATR